MAQYNVSKREAKKLGIKRVLKDGGSSSSTDKDISKYREDLISSLKPTAEENTLGTQISNVEQSRDTGIQQIKEKPIEMNPILGQSRNVEQRAGLEIGTLEDRLGRLQQDRQMNSQALSTALGFAVDDRTRDDERSRYSDAQSFQDKTFEYGKSVDDRAFNESVRQYNQSESRMSKSGGGGSSSDDKLLKAFDADVKSLRTEMDKEGGTSWSVAWNEINRKYPGFTPQEIDEALGLRYRELYDN